MWSGFDIRRAPRAKMQNSSPENSARYKQGGYAVQLENNILTLQPGRYILFVQRHKRISSFA